MSVFVVLINADDCVVGENSVKSCALADGNFEREKGENGSMIVTSH
jgi:hypothetical protein